MSVNIAKLKEQRDAKIAEVDEILKSIQENGEVRALNAEQRDKIANLTDEIKDLKATIDIAEEQRALTPEQKEELKEQRSEEVRAKEVLAKWFRRAEFSAEERALM
ncbi:hypothetical protein V6O07_13235, partial [Arthrospira platensis SPKY2]